MKIFRLIIIMFCLIVTTTISAQKVLTWIIKDKVTGEVLTGASVYFQNKDNRSLNGAIAGADGTYKLKVPDDKNLVVVFSLIGYKTQSMKYTNQLKLDILLEEDSYLLDDVVITAKSLEKNVVGLTSRELVSATQKLSLDILETAPVTSIEDALQGRLVNVDILTSAEPGSSSSIRIRGTSSLNASSEPLFVVDGIPYNTNISDDFEFATANTEDFGALLNIAPSDIESIEVLKDAAATALWGSKGANGVLLISTKKGVSGKTRFNVDIKYQYGKERNTIPMLNASQYVAMIQDAIWNRINDLGSSTSISLMELLYNTKEIGYDPNWIYFNEYNQETNWLKEIIQPSNQTETNFSMSGGGEKATYRLSLGYFNEQGTTRGTNFNRLNTALNVRYLFSRRLDITTDFAFSTSDRDANWDNPRGQALNKMPNMSPYYIDADGKRTSEYFTPESYFQGTINKSKLSDHS
ncbi:TonB-dependent receptor SusC [termite gut metagenome]|uniref:TonB-dependent receptor SusC n=1 Tax=termite gut metagenome TaxID=433724 RepID=A0A5J4QGT9_9ZZZZ